MSAKIRALQAQKAEHVSAMRALSVAAGLQADGMTAEQETQFADLEAKAAAVEQSIQRETRLAALEAGMAAPAPSPAQPQAPPVAAVIQVIDNSQADPSRGFKSFGEYAMAVRGAVIGQRHGVAMDQRLVPLAAAPSTFAGEGNAADGGILIPPGFSSDIFRLSLGEDALLPMADDLKIDGNNMMFPKDETTPWGTNGVRAYWQGEAGSGTPTKPAFGGLQLRLKKLMAFVAVSDELLADQSALASYLPGKVADSIRWKTNESMLFGAGGATPLGAFAGGANVVVAKESGQATQTLDPKNLAKMIARLPPGSFPKAAWIINNDVLPALFTLSLGNYPIYLPVSNPSAGGIQGSPYGTLLGRPVIISQHANSFSAAGDVNLVDLSYYQAITKAEGMVTATSMHLYFDADAMAFRTTFRMDGAPKIDAPIQPAKGSTTLSPFVQLGAR